MTTKTCFQCACEKPLEAFYRHSGMADGRLGKCKECTKTAVRANRAANDDHYRAYDRERSQNPDRVAARLAYHHTEASRVSRKKAGIKWSEANPVKRRAQSAVSNALRDGLLTKQPCHCCGSEAVEGHHPDYSRPLDVVWLCTAHHSELHTEFYWQMNPILLAA